MTTTVVSTIVGAIVAALQAAPAVSADIARVRYAPIAIGSASAVTVRPLACEREAVPLAWGADAVWQVRVGVEVAVRAQAGDASTAELRLDALMQATLSRLMADPTLSGAVPLGMDMTALTYDHDAAAEQFAACTLQLLARVQAGPDLT